MQTKVLMFDFGGVLMRTLDLMPRRRWEIRYGLPAWGLANLVFDNPVAHQATIGMSQSNDVWNYVGAELGLSDSDLADLEHDFWNGDRLNLDLIDYIKSKSEICRSFILSNAWLDARILFDSIPELNIFEEIIISAEVGIAKPDDRIFLHACDKTGVAASQIIFVDDMEENVNAAIALGMNGIIFESTAQTLTDLNKIIGK
jgi:FMN phosphatase YigB (HAD superfamily)